MILKSLNAYSIEQKNISNAIVNTKTLDAIIVLLSVSFSRDRIIVVNCHAPTPKNNIANINLYAISFFKKGISLCWNSNFFKFIYTSIIIIKNAKAFVKPFLIFYILDFII